MAGSEGEVAAALLRADEAETLLKLQKDKTRKAKDKLKALQAQYDELQAKASGADVEALQKQLVQARADNDTLKEEKAAADASTRQTEAACEEAQRGVAVARQEANRLTGLLEAKTAELAAKEDQVRSLEQRVQAAENQVKLMRAASATVPGAGSSPASPQAAAPAASAEAVELARLRHAASTASAQASELEGRLADAVMAKDHAVLQVEQLTRSVQGLTIKLQTADTGREEARTALDAVQSRVLELEAQVRSLQSMQQAASSSTAGADAQAQDQLSSVTARAEEAEREVQAVRAKLVLMTERADAAKQTAETEADKVMQLEQSVRETKQALSLALTNANAKDEMAKRLQDDLQAKEFALTRAEGKLRLLETKLAADSSDDDEDSAGD